MFAHLQTVVLLSILTLFVKADTDDRSKCVPAYCDANYDEIFKRNHTYVYNYDFEIRMESNREERIDEDVFNFNSTVEIYADSTCNLILKIDEVNLTPNTKTVDNNTMNVEDVSELLTENLLIFQYNNGQITKICAPKSDPNWVLNLKLGILSALQYTYLNSTDSYHVMETNLLGECDNIYKLSEADGWRVVRKTTNLQRCSYRTGFQKVTRNLLDDSTTLIQNTHKCRHVLGKLGEPILITCRENYTIQPFDDFSTRTRIKQQMDLDRVVIKNVPVYQDEMFETLESRQSFHVMNDSMNTVNDEESVLQDIIDNYEDTPSVNSDFISMLQSLKYIEYSSLKILIQLQNPLKNKNLWPSIQLVSSSLINIYCSNDPECYDVKEVKQVMKIIESPLEHKFNGKNLDQFVVSLKGVGNAGISYNIEKILRIVQDNTLPLILRLAAIDSFRLMPCQVSRDHFLNVFASQEEYQEIRMKAFFALMICPTKVVINHIANVLYYDSVNQVTSTVWFYLMNMKNSDMFEEAINAILTNQYIQEKFEDASIRNSFRMKSTIDNKLTIFNLHSHLDVYEINIFDELFNKSYNVMQVGGIFKRLKKALEVDNNKKCLYINNIDQHTEGNFIENSSQQEDGDHDGYVYLRIAGFDMFYWNVSSVKSLLEELNKNDLIYKQIPFNREFNILDNVFIVPTSIGLPLEVRIFGVSSIRINNTMTNKQKDPCNIFPESISLITSDLTVDSVMKIKFNDREVKTENHEVSNVEEEIEQTTKYDKGRLSFNNIN